MDIESTWFAYLCIKFILRRAVAGKERDSEHRLFLYYMSDQI
jgi:hypothetical protein